MPHLYLGHVDKNVAVHLEKIAEAKDKHASLVVFPELSLTGATCGDLFRQRSLQAAVNRGIHVIASCMPAGITAVIGAPLCLHSRLYNCAVVISDGAVRGVVPKAYAGDDRIFCSGLELEEEPEMVISAESRDLHFFTKEELKGIQVVITHRDIVEDWFLNK